MQSLNFYHTAQQGEKAQLEEQLQSTQKKLKDLEAEYNREKQQQQQFDTEISMYKAKVSDYESRYQSSENKQREVSRDVTDLKQRIDNLAKENYQLKSELAEEQNRVKNNKREFGKQLREHQRASEKYVTTTREKDVLIEELKSKRSALETEVEKLRKEWEKLKSDYKKVSILQLGNSLLWTLALLSLLINVLNPHLIEVAKVFHLHIELQSCWNSSMQENILSILNSILL